MRNLWGWRACNGVGLRTPDRILVTIREAEAHAIDGLARKPAAASSTAASWRTSTAGTAGTAGPTWSARALKAAALSAKWISALLARRLTWHPGNATASAGISYAEVAKHSAGSARGRALADSPLQQEGIRR